MNLSLQSIIDRIADAFSILDFSYIISGSVTYTILYWILYVCTPGFYETLSQLPILIIVMASCIITYSLGLAVSSAGAWIRGMFPSKYSLISNHVYFNRVSEWNGMLNLIDELPMYAQDSQQSNSSTLEPFKGASNRENIVMMYSYMWNCLASNEKSAMRMIYINKFWVMQKVYEGLFLDAIIADLAVAIMTKNNDIMAFWPCVLVCVVLFLVALVFVNEANKCARTQLHEVVGAYKLYSSNLHHLTAKPSPEPGS